MWKKLLIVCMALVGTFSVGYAYVNINTEMDASSAPAFQLPKGAKVVLGKYNNNELVWDIGNANHSDGYVLMSSKPLININVYNDSIASTCITNVSTVNGNQTTFIYCPPTLLNQEIANIVMTNTETGISLEPPHLPAISDVKTGGNYGLTLADRAFASAPAGVLEVSEWYWLGGSLLKSTTSSFQEHALQLGLSVSGTEISDPNDVFTDSADGSTIDINQELILPVANIKGVSRSLRPFAVIDKNKVNFAVNTSFTDGNWHGYVIDTSNFNKVNELNPVKLRVQSSLIAQLQAIEINGRITNSVTKNQTVQLSVDANVGTSNRISAILYDANSNEIKYYKMLTAVQSGIHDYNLDLTGIPIGSYRVAVINEEYDASSNIPVESSPISNVLDLEISEPHKIIYTSQPESGATSGNDYEFSKNVNAGQRVGKITVNPTGAMPLTYSLEANGDNSYQNFEIDGLNSTNASTNTSLDVKIKNNAPDLVNGGLKAGTYKFCINSVDVNGNPLTPTSNTKVCTSFTVAKTDLTIAFDNPNQTGKSMNEAATPWSETATVTPNVSSGIKITYSITGGYASLVHIDPDTGQVTYNGNNAYNRVVIRATVDDDPSTGNDNYESAYAEKEIVIYREVDGHLTPHSNSSDTTSPTFTTSDANVRANGTIGTVQGTLGTPDTIGGSTTTYSYQMVNAQDSGLFQVNPNTGVITTRADLGVGSYHFSVKVLDHWSSKDVSVTVNVGVASAEALKFYENSSSNTAITSKSVVATDTNVSVYATVRGSTNSNPVTYRIADGSTNVIEVNPNSGAVTIHGVGIVTIIAEKQGAAGQADASAQLTFTVTAGAQNFIYTDSAGNELPRSGNYYSTYTETYAPNGTFHVYTSGNPSGTVVTYQLKSGSSNDVISVDSDGTVHILNASRNVDIGHVTIEATSHDPNGNYHDKTIELLITINRATRTVTFAEHPITVINGNGSVTPVILVDGVTDSGGTAVIEVNPAQSSTAWTNDGHTIQYSYNGNNGINIPISVNIPANRNYENAAGTGTLHILGTSESVLTVSTPGRIVYGDHFVIRSTQDDSMSANVQYSFTVDNTTYISNPTVNGNQAQFDALRYSGNTEITITVTRTADGEVPLSKDVKVKVLPKPITITIDDKNKLKGEANPTLTVQNFNSQLVAWNGVTDVIQPNDIHLNTTANQNSPAGSYPIHGDANTLNNTYPNYTFTITNGNLTITEENIADDWYHLETDDGQPYDEEWTNQDVNIISDHPEYINLSLDQSSWNAQEITVNSEGETNQSFWMKKDSGAITSEKQERIRIDKTAPKVKNIKARDSNNLLQDIIHQLSGGIFFRPGTAFEITTDDTKDNLQVSGTKEIAYQVYRIEQQARSGDTLIREGNLTVTNERASITIAETVGTYRVCVIPTDNAENAGTESCHEVTLKKINVDVDDDGDPDFNDPDGDGCPDLNIKWKNGDDQWVVINGDRNNDSIPDLNIDSDGDGKPDLNIDTDNDGKPDLNLVILTKAQWKPTICVNVDEASGILEEYCTGTAAKPQINVDLDDDGIPDINIDNKGDFKPHLNISKDGETPTMNITTIHDWQPKKNYQSGKFSYDSIGTANDDPKAELNIDTDNDGRPDINLDFDDDGTPDINVDVDGDWIPDMNIDSTGDGQPDVNVDSDNDGLPDENIQAITEWKPEYNVDGEFPYDTMTSFDDPNDPDDPDPDNPEDPDDPNDPDTDVKGGYYPGIGDNMGGASTGDSHDTAVLMGWICLSAGVLIFLCGKRISDHKS